MIIKTLVENTSISDEFKNEHGLSFYVETKKHKLLFDLGASDLFVENAKKLNVKLEDVDIVVISHGHSDHGGGLATFLKLNSKAKIYLNQKAFENHYSTKLNGEIKYNGLDQSLKTNQQIIFVGDYLKIDDELELFSNVNGKDFYPITNQYLLMEKDKLIVKDDFAHEQNLLISEGEKTLLLAGCAHNGIVNIIKQLESLKKVQADYVIGGFHLYSRSKNLSEDPIVVNKLANWLKTTKSKYYTCHCTGIEAFKILKEVLGDQIAYLATGSKLISLNKESFK